MQNVTWVSLRIRVSRVRQTVRSPSGFGVCNRGQALWSAMSLSSGEISGGAGKFKARWGHAVPRGVGWMDTHEGNHTNTSHPCAPEDDFKHLVYTTIYIIVFFVGLLFNGAAIYIFYKIKKKKGTSTICLLNLAAADLIFIVFLPLKITYYLKGAVWIFGDFLCRVASFSFYFSMYSSIFFLACLSVFRYISVAYPGIVNKKKITITCACVWVFTFASTSPFLLSGTVDRGGVTRCFEPTHLQIWKRIMYLNYYALIVGFILPMLIIVVSNVLLIRHIMHMPMEKRSIRKQVIMIVLVLLVCCVCFLPYHVQRTVHLYYLVHYPNICSLQKVLQKAVVATLSLAVLNTCLDPLLYVFIGQGYKQWLLMLCRTKTSQNVKPFSTDSSDVSQENADEVPMNEYLQVSKNEVNNVI
ncbi:PREDICTED: cysteinyl leukotriene receptor 1-like [Nanorana parkeri]|uniref:cysteinyl leukotriene receptor 1-like n=1 Tax=Nanorana parkeri TaxID=125878 RepID=UPI0008547EC1|nr:PREDICTED: cysteinyl leukotriene receptor 1-like [Nanorana parkeri]